jgi:hypothetical protein
MGIQRAPKKSKTSTRTTKSGRTVTKTKTTTDSGKVYKTKTKTGGLAPTKSKEVERKGIARTVSRKRTPGTRATARVSRRSR